MRLRVISFTKPGSILNDTICQKLNDIGYLCEGFTQKRFIADRELTPLTNSLKDWTRKTFELVDGVIFIGACGIAVRAIAPFIQDKYSDPAVICIDESGRFCISLLSGHIGGANELTEMIARLIQAVPVISTATDLHDCFAVDLFAKKNRLWIDDRELAKQVSAQLLEGKKIQLMSEIKIEEDLPEGIVWEANQSDSNLKISISIHSTMKKSETLQLIPRVVTLGIGCKKNTEPQKLEEFVMEQLKELKINPKAINKVVSIDLKKQEQALLYLSECYNWRFETYTAEELKAAVGKFAESEFVQSVTGVGNVCERAAVLGSGNGTLFVHKISYDGMTLAAAIQYRRITFE